jgi:hypothetical protein
MTDEELDAAIEAVQALRKLSLCRRLMWRHATGLGARTRSWMRLTPPSARGSDAIKAATENATLETTGRKGQVTCRFTHVYPDGPAPYFTIHALGEPGKLGALAE